MIVVREKIGMNLRYEIYRLKKILDKYQQNATLVLDFTETTEIMCRLRDIYIERKLNIQLTNLKGMKNMVRVLSVFYRGKENRKSYYITLIYPTGNVSRQIH